MGLTRYRFSATKPGKATLTFEYRSTSPAPGDTVRRVQVHITISKSLTTPAPLIIATTPAPAPLPLPPNPIEAYLDSSTQFITYELSVGQVVNLYLAICEGCPDSAWTLPGGIDDPSVLTENALPPSVPGTTRFSYKAAGPGMATLAFEQSDSSSLYVMITVAEVLAGVL